MCKRDTKGFSLIELLIVIMIIAILAAILLPKYYAFTDDTRKNAALAEAKSIWSIEHTNYANYGYYPVISNGVPDGAGNTQSKLTLADGTVYTFDGTLTSTGIPDGNFTYTKWNGSVTNKLWTITCDPNGNMIETQGT